MSHLNYFSLLVLWATIASHQSFVKAANLTDITWAHAVNSQDLLGKALKDDTINMIEADVTLGKVNKSGKEVPIMAHSLDNDASSDLSLEDFMTQVTASNNQTNATKKGVKLDFKSDKAFDQSTDILKSQTVNGSNWLNADILKGPGDNSSEPVNATNFLQKAKDFDNWGLSLGWTTSNSSKTSSYTQDQVNDMINLLNETAKEKTITFAVRAMYAAESIDQLKSLTDSRNGSTLTIWSSKGDNVDIDHLRDLIRTVGIDKTYIDVPEELSSALHLDTLSNSSPISRVAFPMYILSLVMGLTHILYNAINRI